MTNRLAIVEDHGLFAETIGAALRASGYDVEIVDVVRVHDLVGEVASSRPDMVLLDLELGPGRDATTMVAELSDREIPVVMMTGVTERIRLARCVRAGAVGILSKGMSFPSFLDGVVEAMSTGSLLARGERDDYLRMLRQHETERRGRLARFQELSRRESDVLRALCRGHAVDEIARQSVVSITTVRTQVRAILRKLGVSSQLAATAMARSSGWLDEQES